MPPQLYTITTTWVLHRVLALATSCMGVAFSLHRLGVIQSAPQPSAHCLRKKGRYNPCLHPSPRYRSRHALSSQVFSRPACTTPAFGPPHFRSSPQRLQASHQVTSLQSSTTSPSSLRRIGGVFTSHPSCSHPVPLAPHTASHRPRVWHRVSTSVCPIRAAVKSLRCHAAALGLLGHHTATTQICARCSLASARPRPGLGSLRPLLITLGELPPLHFSHDNQRGLHSRTEAQVRFRALVTQRVVCFFVFPSAFFPSSVFSPLG
jgi:hypothetical protein